MKTKSFLKAVLGVVLLCFGNSAGAQSVVTCDDAGADSCKAATAAHKQFMKDSYDPAVRKAREGCRAKLNDPTDLQMLAFNKCVEASIGAEKDIFKKLDDARIKICSCRMKNIQGAEFDESDGN